MIDFQASLKFGIIKIALPHFPLKINIELQKLEQTNKIKLNKTFNCRVKVKNLLV